MIREHTPTRDELFELEETLNEAALRFDGYAYMALDTGARTPEFIQNLWQQLMGDPNLQASNEDLMASLFHYQRGNPRNMGWFTFRDDEHLSGLHLWLRLHNFPTPAPWRFEPYARKWDCRTVGEKVHAASVVRQWLANGEGTWQP